MENLKLTYRKNGDYFIPNLVLGNEEYKNYQIGKYGYLRLDYLRNYKKAEYELMRINCSLRKHIIEIDLQAKEKVSVRKVHNKRTLFNLQQHKFSVCCKTFARRLLYLRG